MEKEEKGLEDINIKTFSIRDIRDLTLSKFIKHTEDNGISIITTYNQPRCIIMPLTLSGLKKVTKQITGVSKLTDDESEAILSIKKWMEDVHEVLVDINKHSELRIKKYKYER